MILIRYIKLLPLIVAGIALTHTSFAQQKINPISQAKWLIGSWKNQSAKTLDMETWKKLNDSTFLGRSYSLAGADTVSSERISLQQRRGKLYYIPIVRNQNGGKPVTFTLTSSDSKHLIFENPEHDFPQKISYTQITNDSLVAEISGMRKRQAKGHHTPDEKGTLGILCIVTFSYYYG